MARRKKVEQEETEREFVIRHALSRNPLALMLRELLSEIRKKSISDEEWIEWVDKVI